ncbi:Uncharacterised protein [Mobiluncus mulieris]|nr:Uncharacterised protein [Mobiluncus mulieris]
MRFREAQPATRQLRKPMIGLRLRLFPCEGARHYQYHERKDCPPPRDDRLSQNRKQNSRRGNTENDNDYERGEPGHFATLIG